MVFIPSIVASEDDHAGTRCFSNECTGYIPSCILAFLDIKEHQSWFGVLVGRSIYCFIGVRTRKIGSSSKMGDCIFLEGSSDPTKQTFFVFEWFLLGLVFGFRMWHCFSVS